jgi:hypothetical protein
MFRNDEEIHVHPLKIKERNTKRQSNADEEQRLWPHRRTKVAFITHGGVLEKSKIKI